MIIDDSRHRFIENSGMRPFDHAQGEPYFKVKKRHWLFGPLLLEVGDKLENHNFEAIYHVTYVLV